MLLGDVTEGPKTENGNKTNNSGQRQGTKDEGSQVFTAMSERLTFHIVRCEPSPMPLIA